MAFKKQKNSKQAITLFGNQKVLDALIDSKIFSEAGISLSNKDCITIDEALITLRNDTSISYIFISSEAFVGIRNGLETAIEDLRREFHNIKVAIFFSKEKPTEELQNKAFALKIFNLYYAEDGEFDFSKVLNDFAYGKATELIKENEDLNISELAEPSAESIVTQLPDAEDLSLEENETSKEGPEIALTSADSSELEELRKKIEVLEAENKNLKNDNNEILKLKTELQKTQNEATITQEKIKELKENQEAEIAKVKRLAREEKEAIEKSHAEKYETLNQRLEQKEKLVARSVPQGTIYTVGVFSLSNGAGSTYTACTLAELYAKNGYKTACVAYDEKTDLGYIGKSKVDYFYSISKEDKREQLISVVSPGSPYNIVIIDFGTIIPIDSEGKLVVGTLADTQEERNELFRCSMKLALCFDSPWDINKLAYFDSDAAFAANTLFCISPYSRESSNMFPHLQIIDRDSNLIYSCLNESLGLNNQMKKKGLIR